MSVILVSCLIGLSQLVLTVFWLFQLGLHSRAEKLFFLFLIAAAAYIINGAVEPQPWLGVILTALYTSTAGLFCLLCSALFNDNYQLKSWHIGLVAATFVLPTTFSLLKPTADLWHLLLVAIPQTIEYVLILFGLFTTAAYWRDDLVEERRAVRAGTFVVVGLYLLGTIGSQQFFGHNAWWLDSGSYVAAAIILIMLNMFLGSLKQNTLFSPPKPISPVMPIEESDELTARLKEQMEAGVYRKLGLTIGGLAEQVDIQEHNLRRLINKQLGYRNFNDFLNSYRVEEAAKKLKNENLPVLTIALDSGFGSLTSFNQAFKQTYGMTPSQHRKQSSRE